MKEEIRNKAKFFLKQYAENLSDRIGDIKTILTQAEHQLAYQQKRKKGLTVPDDQDDWKNVDWCIESEQKKVDSWKERLEKRSSTLKEIDEVINQL